MKKAGPLRQPSEGARVIFAGSLRLSSLKAEVLIMDVTQIMQAVGSLGFPIVACCALFYYLSKEQEAHKAEMGSVTDALNRNTDALLELKTIITMLTGRRQNNGGSAPKSE